jgi:hypothetical protein
LIDILRAGLRDFRHEDIVNLLSNGGMLRELEKHLLAIESDAKRARARSPRDRLNLHSLYSELVLGKTLIDGMRARIRRDTKVWFNFRSPERYTLRSSLLNRFLASVLCRVKAITPKLHHLEEKSIATRSSSYAVTLMNSPEPQIFDRVVIRHGPPDNYLGSVFPKLDDACAPLRGRLRDLDLTGSLDEETHLFFTP